jgi:hypothetical protein
MGIFLISVEEREKTGPSMNDMQAKKRQQAREVDLGRRARSLRRCEREDMIDATHDL